MDDKETFVKGALSEFLHRNSAEASICAIDEIVLSYMVSILEDLGSESTAEDAFNPEEFTEMMGAYLPGFEEINSVETSEWMFDLAAKLDKSNIHKNKDADYKSVELSLSYSSPTSPTATTQQKRTHSTSEKESDTVTASKATPVVIENGKETESEEPSQEMKMLTEMFPSACSLEITHCLCLSNGDMEKAAQLILHRLETGDCIKSSPRQSNAGVLKLSGRKAIDDTKLKANLLSQYSYVDMDEDKKEHRPHAPKREPKKLVRYLDNKVVSIKGEKFTEIKKADGEDMKKTYVNLKPAKQYRFH